MEGYLGLELLKHLDSNVTDTSQGTEGIGSHLVVMVLGDCHVVLHTMKHLEVLVTLITTNNALDSLVSLDSLE